MSGSFIYACYGTPTVKIDDTGEVSELVSRHLSDDGTDTGNKNANGNYATPTRFYIQPAAGEIFRIQRMIIHVYDSGGGTIQEYGNIGSALANGVIVQTARNGVQTKDFTDGLPVKYNADWSRMCYDADFKNQGAGNDALTVRWTFSKSGAPIRLVGSLLDSLDVVLEDDLTGLLGHYFMVQGKFE